MLRLLIAIICLPALWAGVIPNRYIVELNDEPVASRLARTTRRVDFHSAAALAARESVRAGQRGTRAARELRQARSLGTVDTVANALLVEIPDAEAASLAQLPGVKRVRPVREFKLMLDRALPRHYVPEAWRMVGEDNAGRGAKVAIIDSGIDITHPALQDPSLRVPDGYPRVNQQSDREFTNSKVIVARSYVSLLPRRDPDTSARDRVGHGTATSMVAAGARVSAPLAVISGVAPKAWLGSYKVFGTPGSNDSASEDVVIKAIDDAVADGMDVISISLGSELAPVLGEDLEVQAIERATAAGVIVVVAAGNNGSDPNTIASPATAPSAITVGATTNDRVFAGSLTVEGLNPLRAVPGNGPNLPDPVSGPLADVGDLDQNGLACAALPEGSLRGRVALILRGVCLFEEKINFAAQAGAIGAVVYTHANEPDPSTMSVGTARLPASMIGYQDGLRVKERIHDGAVSGTLRFSLSAVASSTDSMGTFSAAGPNVDLSIKPDIVAVGVDVYTAAQDFDPRGDLYNTTRYAVENGTSFSAPLIAGGAATLKAARPGLTAAQYRSLLINTGVAHWYRPGAAATVQQSGGGLLDLSAALRTTAAAAPVSLSFGSSGPDPVVRRTLTISNIGPVAEAFTISLWPSTAGPVPEVPSRTAELAPGFAVDLPVTFRGASLSAGQYEGFLFVQGERSGTSLRIPYWYGAASAEPAHITILYAMEESRRNMTVSDAVVFRVTDASGIPVPGAAPTIKVVSGGGSVSRIESWGDEVPGAWSATLRMGIAVGANTFRIEAGGVSKEFTVIAQ